MVGWCPRIIGFYNGNRKGIAAARNNPGIESLVTAYLRAHRSQTMQNSGPSQENIPACLSLFKMASLTYHPTKQEQQVSLWGLWSSQPEVFVLQYQMWGPSGVNLQFNWKTLVVPLTFLPSLHQWAHLGWEIQMPCPYLNRTLWPFFPSHIHNTFH